MRLSLRVKEGLAIAALVSLAVGIATSVHLVSVARLGMDEAAATGTLLARQLLLQGRRSLAGARGAPAEVLPRDSGMRALLESMVGYSPTVVYAAITDLEGRALVHSDRAQVGKQLTARERLETVGRQGAVDLLRTLVGSSHVFEAQVPLTLGELPFGTARVGISTALLRRELGGAVTQSLVLGGVAFALALGAGLALGGITFRPLRQIAAGVDRLARGEEHEHLAVDRRDELGELAAKLNLLGDQIHEHRSQLLGERAELEQMVRVLQDTVLFLNREGQLVFASPAAEGLLGQPLEAAAGRPLKDVLAPEHPLLEALDGLLAPGADPSPRQVRLEGAEGAAREVQVTAYPVRDDGRFRGTVITIQDLEPVKAVYSLVDYSARLADMGQLTSGVAHEVKNPLNAMTIHLELLRGTLPPDSGEARESLEVIGKEIHRLDRVVQGFLKFVRPQELRLEPVDVASLFKDVIGLVEVEAGQADVRLDTAVAPGTDGLVADAELLRQALVNVVQNAIQAMPEGGTVTLRAAPAAEGQVELSVEDQGVGIPEEDLAKVFRLYYTTKPEGNGIGLALVYRALQMHGGTVRLDSAVGRGTTVVMRLPRLSAPEREAAA